MGFLEGRMDTRASEFRTKVARKLAFAGSGWGPEREQRAGSGRWMGAGRCTKAVERSSEAGHCQEAGATRMYYQSYLEL